MKCPECEKTSTSSQSRVYTSGGGFMTLGGGGHPFYDEDGNYHCHDTNVTTQTYVCSNRHKFTIKSSGSCWCGWGKDVLPKVEILPYTGDSGIVIIGS
jgi:hypothetical protein